MFNPSRRELLRLAGLSSLCALGMPISNAICATNSLKKSTSGHALGDTDFVLLTDLVDVILPQTGTPSASAVSVHVFVDYMFGQWMSKEQRIVFKRGLQRVTHIAKLDYNADFLELDINKKVKILTAFESVAVEDVGKEDHANAEAFFSLLKHLTIVGYFTSELGVKEALTYDPLPGEYLGCLDIGEKYKSSYIDIFREIIQRGDTDE